MMQTCMHISIRADLCYRMWKVCLFFSVLACPAANADTPRKRPAKSKATQPSSESEESKKPRLLPGWLVLLSAP